MTIIDTEIVPLWVMWSYLMMYQRNGMEWEKEAA